MLMEPGTRFSWSSALRHGLVGWLVATLVAALLTTLWVVNPSTKGDASQWLQVFSHYALICYVWAFLTIGVVAATRYVGLDRRRWPSSLVIYLALGLFFSACHILCANLVMQIIRAFTGDAPHRASWTVGHIVGLFQSNLMFFAVICSVALAVGYLRKFQERELRTTRLESQLVQAQLNALRSQLQPHFLFNTLNAIAALIRDNPETAERMIARLSDLLRTTLAQVDRETVPLASELEFANQYLEIEQMRFGPRMVVNTSVANGLESALVPPLILQPLVENAVQHGVAGTSEECLIDVSVHRERDELVIEVVDNGPGILERPVHRGEGVGLSNIRNRLQHLYASQYELDAGNGDPSGFRVQLRMPLRFGSSDEPSGNATP